MNPKRLDHIVFAVNNLEAAAAAWKRVLGLHVDEWLQPEAIQAKIGLIHVAGRGSASGFLELAQPVASEGPVARALEERGESMLSASIEVDNIDDAVAELKSKGFPISDAVTGPLPHTRVARIAPEATHGVRLQLIDRSG